ncbi:AIPR family protein [Clostridium butyricum]
MITLEEFNNDFIQSVFSSAEGSAVMKSQAFFENVCEWLITSGDITKDYQYSEYLKTGIEISGFDYDNERGMLTLLVNQFYQDEEIQTITLNTINSKTKRIQKFYTKCLNRYYLNMEETDDAFTVAYNIYDLHIKNKIRKIRFIILTNGKLTRTFEKVNLDAIKDIETEYRIIDIEYLYSIFISEQNQTNLEVDIILPSLKIKTNSNEYESYLTYITGEQLAEIYETHGQKLFEQNVRTFLQFRGNVNKGLKNTIKYDPEKFFAYNNGITATATEVNTDEEGNITHINNFQIVNGGQTTSAIYAARKLNKMDVTNINVQMKLSVVRDKEKQDDFVSKVSEYANTQNKVNKSDFFSNSPFHKEMKKYSQRTWAPVVNGSQKRTHWFYERVRGEYLNEQAYLTKANKTKFKIENPKSQFVDKKFISKPEIAWLLKPHIVSKGVEYCFSEFANEITNKIENNEYAITESYFRDVISRVIMFKSIEKIVTKAVWYSGGYRAQVVAYTISLLSLIIERKKKYLNFDLIWEKQDLPNELKKILEELTEYVYNKLLDAPMGYVNVAQWAKQKDCWEKFVSGSYDINIDECLLISKNESKIINIQVKKDKKLEKEMEDQIFIVGLDNTVWTRLFEYYSSNYKESGLGFSEIELLIKMKERKLILPNEKQSRVLRKIYNKALEEGVKFEIS